MRWFSTILSLVCLSVYGQTYNTGSSLQLHRDTVVFVADFDTLNFDTVTVGVSPNYTAIWKDGTVRSYGNATAYDDLFFPFQTGTTGGGSYPAYNADSLYWDFSAVDTTGPTKCVMYFQVQIPHSYAAGTKIYPHIHYKHETAVGTPKFVFKYKWFNIGSAVPATWSRYNMNVAIGTTNNTHPIS